MIQIRRKHCSLYMFYEITWLRRELLSAEHV
jgi:hypothetical protein